MLLSDTEDLNSYIDSLELDIANLEQQITDLIAEHEQELAI